MPWDWWGLCRRKEEEDTTLTIENSLLAKAQKDAARKALRILNLEANQDELSKQDLIVLLYALGMNPTDDLLESKIRGLTLHMEDTFTIGQLAHIWHSMLEDLTDEEEILKRAFFFFDKDGNGEISVQELRTTMHELGDLLTEEEIVNFMAVMDVDNDGVVGYQEFLLTLKTQTPDLGGKRSRRQSEVHGEPPEASSSKPKRGPSSSNDGQLPAVPAGFVAPPLMLPIRTSGSGKPWQPPTAGLGVCGESHAAAAPAARTSIGGVQSTLTPPPLAAQAAGQHPPQGKPTLTPSGSEHLRAAPMLLPHPDPEPDTTSQYAGGSTADNWPTLSPQPRISTSNSSPQVAVAAQAQHSPSRQSTPRDASQPPSAIRTSLS